MFVSQQDQEAEEVPEDLALDGQASRGGGSVVPALDSAAVVASGGVVVPAPEDKHAQLFDHQALDAALDRQAPAPEAASQVATAPGQASRGGGDVEPALDSAAVAATAPCQAINGGRQSLICVDCDAPPGATLPGADTDYCGRCGSYNIVPASTRPEAAVASMGSTANAGSLSHSHWDPALVSRQGAKQDWAKQDWDKRVSRQRAKQDFRASLPSIQEQQDQATRGGGGGTSAPQAAAVAPAPQAAAVAPAPQAPQAAAVASTVWQAATPIAAYLVARAVATIEELEAMPNTQPYAMSSTALKYMRDMNEQPRGEPKAPAWNGIEITDQDPIPIGVLLRTTGMDYSFQAGATQDFSWRFMFCAMRAPDRETVMGRGDGCGVSRIWIQPMRGSYDHKRCHAAKVLQRPYPTNVSVPVWDFVVERPDGTKWRFHPNQTKNRVEVASMDEPPAQPPSRGRGLSDGPGTYRSLLVATWPINHPRADRGGGGSSASGATNAGLAWMTTGAGQTPTVQPNDTRFNDALRAEWQRQSSPAPPAATQDNSRAQRNDNDADTTRGGGANRHRVPIHRLAVHPANRAEHSWDRWSWDSENRWGRRDSWDSRSWDDNAIHPRSDRTWDSWSWDDNGADQVARDWNRFRHDWDNRNWQGSYRG